jgi:hypothetical protein
MAGRLLCEKKTQMKALLRLKNRSNGFLRLSFSLLINQTLDSQGLSNICTSLDKSNLTAGAVYTVCGTYIIKNLRSGLV